MILMAVTMGSAIVPFSFSPLVTTLDVTMSDDDDDDDDDKALSNTEKEEKK